MAKGAQLESRLQAIGTQFKEEAGAGTDVFIFLQRTARSPIELLWSECQAGVDDAGVQNLLPLVRRRQRSVLVYDVEKDSNLRGLSCRFQSAIGVPIFDGTRTPIGMLLATSERPEAFGNNHKFALERISRELGGTLEAYTKSPETSGKKKTTFDFLYSPVTLVASAIILFGLVVWSLGPSDPEPKPEPSSRPNCTLGPTEVAEEFLNLLREGRLEEGWSMLTPSLRKSWSSADFSKALTDWIEAEKHREVLDARAPSRVQRKDQEAVVILFESSVVGDSGRWNWHLVQHQGDWRISKFEGGPIESP